MATTTDEAIDATRLIEGPSLERLKLAELAHRTANDLGVVLALLRYVERTLPTGAAIGVGKAIDRIAGVAVTQRLLIPPLRNDPADMKATLEKLGQAIAAARLRDGRVALIVQADPCTVDAETCWMVATLVAEFITNSVKHAFGDEAGTIVVMARVIGRTLAVRVSDDGRGLGARKAATAVGGGEIVDALVAALGAEFARETGADGTVVKLWIRLDEKMGAKPCRTALYKSAQPDGSMPERATPLAVARLEAPSMVKARTPLRRLLGVVFSAAAKRPRVVNEMF